MLMHVDWRVRALVRFLFAADNLHEVVCRRFDPGVLQNLVRRELVLRCALCLPIHTVIKSWHHFLQRIISICIFFNYRRIIGETSTTTRFWRASALCHFRALLLTSRVLPSTPMATKNIPAVGVAAHHIGGISAARARNIVPLRNLIGRSGWRMFIGNPRFFRLPSGLMLT